MADGPYLSLRDLVSRANVQRDDAEALIRAGALDSFGIPRRELLWQLGLLLPSVSRLERAPAATPEGVRIKVVRRQKGRAVAGVQSPLPLPTAQDMVELPLLSPWQQLAWEYETTGVSATDHPMRHIRPLLNEGLVTSLHVGGPHNPNRLPNGKIVEMAGMVVTRQKPQTASGVLFMLLEDEFGLTNLVVYNALQEKQRELVRATPFVIVKGRIDNDQSGFPNIIATSFRKCPLPGLIEAPDSHDFG